MKKLPLGIQTFSKIREGDYTYVDKTEFVHKLVDNGEYYFLSRPRRFGKSLFVDTLQEAFEGNQPLFKGLYLDHHWDWSKKHPVIKISFGGGTVQSIEELKEKIFEIIEFNKSRLGIVLSMNHVSGRFAELIRKAADKYGQKTVILVDEYDKPILDNITNTDTAVEIREGLKSLYSVIKDNDAYIRFVFLTGVSKFSKVSLFSGLNNLKDITLHREYGTLCGYTQSELEIVFEEHLQGLDMDLLKRWYDGYSWLGEHVYNPFGILNVLQDRDYKNYWFETATPTFMIKLLQKNRYNIPSLESLEVGEEVAMSFDVERISPEALLFQAGYLTIEKVERIGAERIYTLKYPNIEVKSSFSAHILNNYLEDPASKTVFQKGIYSALKDGRIEELEKTFKALFASIPHDWYRKNKIDEYEGYYASIFYSYFASLGLDMKAEDTTNRGNMDLTVKFGENAYIFEFKMVEKARVGETNVAFEQVKKKKYHEKFQGKDMNIFLIGIEFAKQERNIVGIEWEKMAI